ncbi:MULTISPECIES: GUN4 domain-containing protein [Oscillatoriophycideae]|uniref:GUN4 domain-containing protein n=1 Tax=Oscillatoriophycideae TaxID=1301283 RepID=UPI0028A9F244|nr:MULTISPECIES: GUN4 domain-containing protein [Oscillatoriophycideae]WOB67183.1 GUN4 domain-containing protein [Microcystis aeruginosa LE3]
MRFSASCCPHYSNGKFGFSVQKEIYESLRDTREYNSEVWKKFGDHIGWKKGENCLSYSDLIFNKNAPKAYFLICIFHIFSKKW